MTQSYDKLKNLLEQLFQFDQADLDFGIYRIMNQKRGEVSRFLDQDLLPQVQESLGEYSSASAQSKRARMRALEERARELDIAPDAIPEYKQLEGQLAEDANLAAVESEVYSDLYNFFRRYYKDGDFLSLRRHKQGTYAIPYEGEEVKLHWANADQYYVKTAEHFTNYRFQLPDGRYVDFRLASAGSEQNNNKESNGKERRFVLMEDIPAEEVDGELIIYFEYRVHPDKQKDLNERALKTLFEEAEIPAWRAALGEQRPTQSNGERTLLGKHLQEYTARNTFDYFIHKDLGGFLRCELDFFLKNEVLRVDDLDSGDESLAGMYLARLRATKQIGRKIIAFLAQIEDFQKKLFEKKKFVLQADYCMTLDNVPEDLYPQILENEEQFDEWEDLFSISELPANLENGGGERNVEWLKANPYLVLDTKFFDEDFKERLLSSIENLDEKTDGLLVESENFQALNLLQNRYAEQVKCVYIDPPFNTGDDGFLYKDNYQHSSWLAMMHSRLESLYSLLDDSGSLFVHIDDNELGYLLGTVDKVFDRDNQVSVVTFKQSSVSGPKAMNPGLANISSFVLWYAKDKSQWAPSRAYVPTKRDDRYNNYIVNYSEHHSEWKLTTLRNAFAESVGVPVNQVKKHFGDSLEEQLEKFVLEAPEKVVRLARVAPKDVNAIAREQLLRSKDYPDTIHRVPREDREDYYFQGGQQLIFYSSKVQEAEGERVTVEPASTIWTDVLSNNIHAEGGVTFENGKKPVALLKRIAELSARSDDLILDCFAGSGTTGHAVIDLNREDGGNRKYVLTEVGEYFDSVLKPRIQKVVYSQDWKGGKPQSRNTGVSHIFKYMQLESYEDALGNLTLARSGPQQEIVESDDVLRENYMLSYMLDLEAEGSASLLTLEGFENPFSYKMTVTRDDESREETVDLVETFNYLLGLTVSRVRSKDGFKTVEGADPEGRRVLVIWRNTNEKSNEDLESFFKEEGYASRREDEPLDLVYVNGDSSLERLKEKGDGWTVHLTEEEFRRRMFERPATGSA